MGWIAGKQQKVKRDGKYVDVAPGDPIPEAEFWPNRNAWERQGYIRLVGSPSVAPSVVPSTQVIPSIPKLDLTPSVPKVKHPKKSKPKTKKAEKPEEGKE